VDGLLSEWWMLSRRNEWWNCPGIRNLSPFLPRGESDSLESSRPEMRMLRTMDLPILCSLTKANFESVEGILAFIRSDVIDTVSLPNDYRYVFTARAGVLGRLAEIVIWNMTAVDFSPSRSSLNRGIRRFNLK